LGNTNTLFRNSWCWRNIVQKWQLTVRYHDKLKNNVGFRHCSYQSVTDSTRALANVHEVRQVCPETRKCEN
jgi:hypothetical protein